MRVRLIGYWRGGPNPAANVAWPDPGTLIDESWDQRERLIVASYLTHGFMPWVAAGVSPCRICGKPNGSAELTDGVYLWPEGLAHYVAEHSVRLPPEVLQHIDAQLDSFEALDV